jgi:hypothetical protein
MAISTPLRRRLGRTSPRRAPICPRKRR